MSDWSQELREHALVIGDGDADERRARPQYYVDAKRAILLPEAFMALGLLVAERARACDASAVGGVPVSAIPVACAALVAPVPPAKVFIVRKERKEHGLQRWIEGPPLDSGERCLIVEDVVTSGGSTIEARGARAQRGLDGRGRRERARPAGRWRRGDSERRSATRPHIRR